MRYILRTRTAKALNVRERSPIEDQQSGVGKRQMCTRIARIALLGVTGTRVTGSKRARAGRSNAVGKIRSKDALKRAI